MLLNPDSKRYFCSDEHGNLKDKPSRKFVNTTQLRFTALPFVLP
jgi:hypothetical protein